ncbi:hypothetical protein MKW92_029570 [Papaver armeniacum]|nr:hypothetical protein MKW92_029570 [Papaver armeniacum]
MSYREAKEHKMELVKKSQNQETPVEEKSSTKGGLITLPSIVASSNFLAIFGAFLCDSYLGRFRVIALCSIASFLGIVQLLFTAIFPQMKPKPCDSSLNVCDSATPDQPSSLTFGVDQLAQKYDPAKDEEILQAYFNLYYATIGVSTVIVYIQDQMGWQVGFAVPAILMVFTSLFTGFVRVVVAAWRIGVLVLVLLPNQLTLRFLKIACIIRDPEEHLKPDRSPTKPWELCTVIIPIWSTGFMIYMTLSQNSIPVLQAKTMNRHITTNFEIPAGSFALLYTGKPNGISATIRMGIGLLLSCIAMAIAGIVERIRRRNSVEENFSISALWLVPQFCLIGLAEAFNAIGQIEFYYRQLPKSMSSVAVAFFTLGTAFSGLLGGLIISVVDKVTKSSDSKESWVSRNPNLGHYDYYYWFLTFLKDENTIASDEEAEVSEGMLEKSRDFPSCSSA